MCWEGDVLQMSMRGRENLSFCWPGDFISGRQGPVKGQGSLPFLHGREVGEAIRITDRIFIQISILNVWALHTGWDSLIFNIGCPCW